VKIELKAGLNDAGRRLDRILRKALKDYPLSFIHRLLRQGKVLVNGTPAGPGDKIPLGATIEVFVNQVGCDVNRLEGSSGLLVQRPPSPHPPSGNFTPEILWQGAGIIVVNKPSGIATHGPSSLDTSVNAWLSGKMPPSLSFRPGPLHRLDRPTSGAIIFSETLEGAQFVSLLLRERKLEKTYLAIVEGRVANEECWQDDLARDKKLKKTFVKKNEEGAKEANTQVIPLASNGDFTLVKLLIKTGRTHQIRVQAASHGHPLAGDIKYGSVQAKNQQWPKGIFFLHAWKIAFNGLSITAPIPQSFQEKIHKLFGFNAICGSGS
jgi:23S rRNA pseudouridine955/2504/2580 synthase